MCIRDSCYTEVFNPTCADGSHKFKHVGQVLETYWASCNHGVLAHANIGMQGGVQNLMPVDVYRDFWHVLPRDVKVISVRRRNLLERHVSHLKAKKTKIWNKQNSKGTVDVSVDVDVDKLVRDADFVKKCWRLVDDVYPGRLVVFYEDMVKDAQAQFNRVFDYLKVSHQEVSSDTTKLGRNLKQDIKNHSVIMRQIHNKKIEKDIIYTG